MVVVATRLCTVVPGRPKGSMPWPIRHTAPGVSQRRLVVVECVCAVSVSFLLDP